MEPLQERRRTGFISTLKNKAKGITNQNPLFKSRDWLSANQGQVFPDLHYITGEKDNGFYFHSKKQSKRFIPPLLTSTV